jgi:hypothetical protein
LARSHSEHRNPVLTHQPGRNTVEFLTGETGIDVCGADLGDREPGISVNTPPTLPGPGTCRPQSTLIFAIGPADSVVVDPHAAHAATRTPASVAALIRVV